jgi:ABC-type transport system substrate-binding protein
MAPFLFGQYYLTGSPRNYAQYSNPKVDEAIKKARTATTEEESRKYWREFQRLVTEDVANYWVGNGLNLIAVSNRLKGVGGVATPHPGVLDTLEYTYFAK